MKFLVHNLISLILFLILIILFLILINIIYYVYYHLCFGVKFWSIHNLVFLKYEIMKNNALTTTIPISISTMSMHRLIHSFLFAKQQKKRTLRSISNTNTHETIVSNHNCYTEESYDLHPYIKKSLPGSRPMEREKPLKIFIRWELHKTPR